MRGRQGIWAVDGPEKEVCLARKALCWTLELRPDQPVWRGKDLVSAFVVWRCGLPADPALPLPWWRGGALEMVAGP